MYGRATENSKMTFLAGIWLLDQEKRILIQSLKYLTYSYE